MKIALIIIALVLLIFAVLLFVPFFLIIEFSKKEDKKNSDIRIKYLVFNIKIKYKKNKTEKKKNAIKEKDDITLTEKVKNGIEIFKEIEDDVVDILHYASEKTVKIRNLTFFLDFGLSDPMNTGISLGLIYGVVYNVLAFLNNFFGIEESNVKINPDFERKHLDISSQCILKIKSVHIIIIVFKVLKMYFKIKKTKKGSFLDG